MNPKIDGRDRIFVLAVLLCFGGADLIPNQCYLQFRQQQFNSSYIQVALKHLAAGL